MCRENTHTHTEEEAITVERQEDRPRRTLTTKENSSRNFKTEWKTEGRKRPAQKGTEHTAACHLRAGRTAMWLGAAQEGQPGGETDWSSDVTADQQWAFKVDFSF